MVIGRRIRQMHTFEMNDFAVRLEFQVFTREMESTAFSIRPLETHLATRFCLADAHRHRPAFRSEHPFLDYLRIGMRAVNRFRMRSEAPGYDHVFVTFGFQG